MKCVRVHSGEHTFAIPCEDVDRTVALSTMNLTGLPGASDVLKGALSVGGTIYVVSDLKKLCGGLPSRIDVKSRAICLVNPVAGAMFAILVDRVIDIIDCDMSTASPRDRLDLAPWTTPLRFGSETVHLFSARDIYEATHAACVSAANNAR